VENYLGGRGIKWQNGTERQIDRSKKGLEDPAPPRPLHLLVEWCNSTVVVIVTTSSTGFFHVLFVLLGVSCNQIN
jgi:hypothetical protein